LFLLCIGDFAHSVEVSFLTNPGPMDNALWLIDPETRQQYGQIGIHPSDSRWHIVQWGILNPLPVKTERYGKGWRTQNKDAGIGANPSLTGGYIFDLKQDSRNPNYGANEFDLFLEPNHFILPSLPQNLIHYDNQPSLSLLKAVHIKAWQKITSARHGTRGSSLMGVPGYDLASTLLAVAMINPFTSPQQILFYQIITYDSRGSVFNKEWFDYGTYSDPYMTYGVSDSVQNCGVPALTIGKGIAYNLNIIDRLKQVVLEGPVSLDKDLNHWKAAGGLYFGSWVNGEATIRSKIGFIDFTYEM
jgi:hypothetical protein